MGGPRRRLSSWLQRSLATPPVVWYYPDMAESPEELVKDFVTSLGKRPALSRPGCCTCRLNNINDINRAIKAFASMKDEGQTTQSWNDFLRYVLLTKFNYPFKRHAMQDHIKDCLGL